VADVYALAAAAAESPELEVVPLFETVEDLARVEGVLDAMIRLDAVRRWERSYQIRWRRG
jgi:phosphoenolpyruvate carboxylase